MKCPACLSIMFNRDEIHNISPTRQRMNLHCWNMKCPARTTTGLYYGPYMQVITEDPKPWECSNYGLIVMRGFRRLLLQGSYFDGTRVAVTEDLSWKTVKQIGFVKLSTGDDMHTQAIELADKLSKLLPFI